MVSSRKDLFTVKTHETDDHHYLLFSAEPHFLHAIDYGNYVYFFLSEIAVEYTALGKVCGTIFLSS